MLRKMRFLITLSILVIAMFALATTAFADPGGRDISSVNWNGTTPSSVNWNRTMPSSVNWNRTMPYSVNWNLRTLESVNWNRVSLSVNWN